MFRTRKVPTQIFGNVRCLILRIKTNGMRQCWCGLATDIWEKSRLNCKLKISNTTNNAGITQSQARDISHRRMQEVNSLCTYSRPLWANTYCVIPHNTTFKLRVPLLTCRQWGVVVYVNEIDRLDGGDKIPPSLWQAMSCNHMDNHKLTELLVYYLLSWVPCVIQTTET